jgi:hypothetical protein
MTTKVNPPKRILKTERPSYDINSGVDSFVSGAENRYSVSKVVKENRDPNRLHTTEDFCVCPTCRPKLNRMVHQYHQSSHATRFQIFIKNFMVFGHPNSRRISRGDPRPCHYLARRLGAERPSDSGHTALSITLGRGIVQAQDERLKIGTSSR